MADFIRNKSKEKLKKLKSLIWLYKFGSRPKIAKRNESLNCDLLIFWKGMACHTYSEMSLANMASKVTLLQDPYHSIDVFYLLFWEILRMEGCVENLAIFMFSWRKYIRTSSFSYHQHADPNGCLKPLVKRHCSADLAIKIILVRFDTSWLHHTS